MVRLVPLLVLVLLAAACSSSDDGSDGTPTSANVEVSVELLDDHALIGRLLVESDEPIAPRVAVTGEERSFEIPTPEVADRHEIPVVGLRAEHDYTVTVTVGDDETSLPLRTGALPDDFPDIDVVTTDTARMAEGVTLFNVLGMEGATDGSETAAEADPGQAGLLLAVDHEGAVVWYQRSDHPIGDARQLDDGTILHEYNDTGARRIDLLGRVLDEWAGEIIAGPLSRDEHGRQVVGDDAVVVPTDSMHHEVGRTPEGNLLVVSSELRTYEGFTEPLCGEGADFDGTYDLIVDVIVEFTPDGEVVAEYPLADHFDPVDRAEDQNVCGLPFDDVFPNWLYRAQGFAGALDWTHANGAVVDPTGEAITVSVRHLDAILQIDRTSGELRWRFGPGGDFAVEHPSDFSSHQHAPEWQGDGTLLVYDNGNERAPDPGAPEDAHPYSRAVQYRLEPEAGTAEVVWSFTSTVDGEPAFASFVGDADRLANGNVLVTNGGYAGRPDGVSAQIVEAVPDESPAGGEVAFEIRLSDPRQLIVYRAERLSSLYGE